MIRKMMVSSLALALVLLLAVPAPAQMTPRTLDAWIAPTSADTAGVLLQIPGAGRTIRIVAISVFSDNSASANTAYAGIVTADAAQTRYLWVGKILSSTAIGTDVWEVHRKIPAAIAQAGVRLYISGASTDTLSANVEYEIVTDN